MRVPRALVVFSALLAVSACGKDPPQKPTDDAPKATPVPSDMVFNDFLPQGGGSTTLAVRGDGGLIEAGAATAAGEGGAPAAAAGAEPNAGPDADEEKIKVTVLEAGAEPRAARKYVFALNQPDRRVFTMRQTMSQQGRSEDTPALAMTMDLTAKQAKPKATAFEMKVIKVDFADRDKIDPKMMQQAQQQLAVFTGLAATLDVSPHGTPTELAFAANEKMQKPGVAELLEAFQQAVELMLAPLPSEPIGQGAKWERTLTSKKGGLEQSTKSTFELKELAADGTGGTIGMTLETKVPKRPLPDPRMQGGTVEVNGRGTYAYTFRFDHIATKVVGEVTNNVKIEVPNPQTGQKQQIVQQLKLKHLIEAPAK